jgi:amidohydrolase
VNIVGPVMGSEDFPVFTKDLPGLFFALGGSPRGSNPATQPANHSPLFFVDEGALPVGVRAMASLALDYLRLGGAPVP